MELARLRRENEDLRLRVAELTDLSDQDPLLGVLNRRAFLRELGRVQAYSKRHGLVAAIVFFDLDGLAEINNRHGHEAGDESLRCVCRTVRACIRASDLLGRLGGDEFGLVLVGTAAADADRKMQAICDTLSQTRVQAGLDPKGLKISITYGVQSILPDCAPEALIARADEQFYGRKGRNGFTRP
jgi:diguanylate cyclase (GGDEF)-like protein